MKKKALIAMSGGVDSSVAALLMKERGYECAGITMKLYSPDDEYIPEEQSCCTTQDIEDARKVADALDIPYDVVNFSDNFREHVLEPFVFAYENGATPNPCINCNRHLKFESLFKKAQEMGLDCVVTGHYARIAYDETSGRWFLKKGLDHDKDQSYVLYNLTQEQLAHTLFPLGEMHKPDVRALAEKHGFVNAEKKESMDICFVKDEAYYDFIERFTGKNYPEGDFVDASGNSMGTHKGIIRYTVGQRKGLGLALKAPAYVCKVDPDRNQVVLGSNDDLFSTTLVAKDINLISVSSIDEPMRVMAKVRSRHKEAWATVTQIDEDTIQVVFDEPQRAITKGQAVVLYDGEVVVGGGTIQ